MDVEASQDVLIDVFERIENFFRRLEIYTDVPPTPAMTDMMVKIMVEVLDILGTATKEMKESRASRSSFPLGCSRLMRIIREISQEGGGNYEAGGWSEKARQNDERRGSNGKCGVAEALPTTLTRKFKVSGSR
jgi:hypothetical protein